MQSPSTGEWAGRTARAMPSWAMWATAVACVFVRVAFVATTPIVVFVSGSVADGPASRITSSVLSKRPGAPRGPAMTCPVALSTISPKALTATSAATDEVADALRRRADAALQAVLHRPYLGDGRARAGADAPLGDASALRGKAGAIAAFGGGTDVGAADVEVEQDGAADDGDGRAGVGEADAALFEVAHDAGADVEAVGAAAGEEDGVDLLDERFRSQERRLAGAGRSAADVDAGDGALLAEDDGAAGGGAPVGPVADAKCRRCQLWRRSVAATSVSPSSGWQWGQKWVLRPPTLMRAISVRQT